jgi:hypothetical protein
MLRTDSPSLDLSGSHRSLPWLSCLVAPTGYAVRGRAWPLYSAMKLIGAEFHLKGVSLKAGIPLDEYEFNTPLLGFKKVAGTYSGWYAPMAAGKWSIDIMFAEVNWHDSKR